jgi:GNAT superfamily N-acetyltransferase
MPAETIVRLRDEDIVGVSPAAQGRGLGRALLLPLMDRADAAGQPCYLETAQPTNIPFYKHLGFRQVVETREPKSGLQLWTFRRDPPNVPPSSSSRP